MTLLTDIENAFSNAEQDAMNFLQKVASGAEIFISDIEAIGSYIAAHIGIINSTVATIATAAATIAPGNTGVQNAINLMQQGVAGLDAYSASLNASGNQVTAAVAGIAAVKQASVLTAQAQTALANLTAASATATQAVTPGTSNLNASA